MLGGERDIERRVDAVAVGDILERRLTFLAAEAFKFLGGHADLFKNSGIDSGIGGGAGASDLLSVACAAGCKSTFGAPGNL
jgi:hypothetical protein